MAICKLCRQDRPLIKAHVIPRAFYPPRSSIGDTIIVPGFEGGYPRRTPIGVYDEDILCKECDASLGKLDQHVAETVLRGKHVRHALGTAREYVDADPELVLRFAGSVAWRAAVSTHDMFNTMRLGPYVDKLHSWLSGDLERSPIDCWLAEFETDDVPFLNPHQTRFSGVRVAVIYAGRLVFYVKLDKRKVPPEFEKLRLVAGRPVYSVVRNFRDGKEAPLMRRMIEQPSVQKLRDSWAKRRAAQSN